MTMENGCAVAVLPGRSRDQVFFTQVSASYLIPYG